MRIRKLFCLLSIPCVLVACVQADTSTRLGMTASRQSSHGSRGLAPEELRATCRDLAQNIATELALSKDLEKAADVETKAPPNTVYDAWSRATGQDGNGIPALRGYTRARNRIAAMNAELQARGCEVVEIDAELQPL